MTDWLDKSEYPFSPRRFSLPEGKLHYLDEGSGSPIVLLHGTPDWSFSYRKVIKTLLPDHRCIAVDQLGFGLSDKPPDADYRPEKQAERFAAFVNGFDFDTFSLVVHDFAGPIGLAYALAKPEKIHRLVIMNTWLWGLRNDPFYANFSRLMHTPLGRFFYLQLNGSPRFILKSAFADKSHLPRHIHQHYLKVFPNPASRTATLTYAKALLDSHDWYESLWQVRDRIAAIPAVLIWGMKDIAFKEATLMRLKTIFHTKQVIRLEHCGHFPQEENPQEVAAAIKDCLTKCVVPE